MYEKNKRTDINIDDKYSIRIIHRDNEELIVVVTKYKQWEVTNRLGETYTKESTQYYSVKISKEINNEIIISNMHRSSVGVKLPKKVEKELINIFNFFIGNKEYYFLDKNTVDERVRIRSKEHSEYLKSKYKSIR